MAVIEKMSSHEMAEREVCVQAVRHSSRTRERERGKERERARSNRWGIREAGDGEDYGKRLREV